MLRFKKMFILSLEVKETMARPLDGIALLAYTRRLKLSKESYELLTRIRSSPPSRTPGARRGNMPVWYPSKKMQCIMKAESTKVEFPFLLAAEHDDDVLEIWDQPPSIPLEYLDKHGHLQRPMHTADYFVFRYRECGWVECKPAQELLKQAETRPNRYGRLAWHLAMPSWRSICRQVWTDLSSLVF